MILDSSAVLAILRTEPDARDFAQAIQTSSRRHISAANYLEVCMVIDGARNPVASREVDEFFLQAKVAIEPVTEAHARIARWAYRDFGKGSGHPAKLNFGDCFAYALAKTSGEPLLFKGDDFGHTDIRVAK
jgi:ribonuclease VapC